MRDCVLETPFPPVYIQLDRTRDLPRVDAPRSGTRPVLAAGDLLLSWGGTALRGARDTEFMHVVVAHSSERLAQVRFERQGKVHDALLETGSFRRFWPRLAASVVFLLTAAVFVLRGPMTLLTRSIVCMLTSWAFLFCCTFAGPLWLLYMSLLVQMAGVSGSAVFGLRTTLLFPHGMVPSSRWMRALPYAFAVLGPLDVERVEALVMPRELAHRLCFALYVGLLVANAVLAARNYRRASPLERRKLKWLLWAVWIASSLSVLTALIAIAQRGLSLQYYVALSSMVLIPLALLISITRFNSFDIDRILSATASIWLLVGGATLVIMLASPTLTDWLSHAASMNPAAAQTLVSGVVALLAVFIGRRLVPWVDTKLFVERAALQAGLATLLRDAGKAHAPASLLELVGIELGRLLRPEKLAIYRRSGLGWEPCFARGRAVAPAMPADSRILTGLEYASGALCFERGRRWTNLTMSELDVAFIEALDARVSLPVRGEAGLVAAIFIGAKGSGDVFVQSDLAMLGSLSHVLSDKYTRLEQSLASSATSAERDAPFRRYVPNALASQLALDGSVEDGERDVTLMFVDIRGYSTYAENREPAEVFSTVTAYTLRVTEVVRRHEGTVVEFNGDGMMAVFGAPHVIANKESKAVEAGFELALAVGASLPPAISGRGAIPIGIGLATGRAFVGSVRGSDRDIWTALGAATNRAARLQALTRELDTDLLIDEPTWRSLGPLRDRFELCPGVVLRGHTQRLNLYARVLARPVLQAQMRPAI
jgi:class 3 adenylate cyclase